MEKRTIKIMTIMVGLLCLNIEAAQAGLVKELQLFVKTHLSEPGLVWSLSGLVFGGSITAVLLLPVKIGNTRKIWFTKIEPGQLSSWSLRRKSVEQIANTLGKPEEKTTWNKAA